METITIIREIHEQNIFVPKPKRLFRKKQRKKSNKILKTKTFHPFHPKIFDEMQLENEKEINLDKISFDEIKEDFKVLDEKIEEEICYEELSNILLSSSEDSISNGKIKNIHKKNGKKTDY